MCNDQEVYTEFYRLYRDGKEWIVEDRQGEVSFRSKAAAMRWIEATFPDSPPTW